MDFSTVVNYGSNNHGESGNVEHLLRTCHHLKNITQFYGITYDNERFPIILDHTLNDFNEKKILRHVDTIFFCHKGDWEVGDENGAINYITSRLYYRLLADYRRQIISPKKLTILLIFVQIVSMSYVGDSCVAVIEGKAGFIPHFKVGLFHMSDLAQFEASDLVKNYFPEQDYQFFPIDHLALKNKRSCRPRKIVEIESDSEKYLNFSECVTLTTPDFYYQLCCCDENFEICGSLEDDYKVDPGKSISLAKEFLDQPDKLAEYEFGENSVYRNYHNKPKIVCAIGTLKMNETLREERLIDKAFPTNVRSCQSIYYYKKGIGEDYQM
ncbi:hypothetical protein LOAG_09754 [Loa loa]|uniref:Uncharacterized protein n=1 Tax=Loa loa TaxID=7209 RepID=A0A1S0TR43_LOALO|nr:hypothetical protein LOAG_09754 [Loa loa]EFO18743.1 hypothetical protein LOAG_09754 [Loa loa]